MFTRAQKLLLASKYASTDLWSAVNGSFNGHEQRVESFCPNHVCSASLKALTEISRDLAMLIKKPERRVGEEPRLCCCPATQTLTADRKRPGGLFLEAPPGDDKIINTDSAETKLGTIQPFRASQRHFDTY